MRSHCRASPPGDGGVPAGPQSLPAEPLVRAGPGAYDRALPVVRGTEASFAVDPAFSPAGGDVLKDVAALAVAPGGALWIASGKTKSAVSFDSSGRAGLSLSAQEPRALSLTPAGEIVLAAETAVRVGTKEVRTFTTPPTKAGGPPEPVERILAAALTPGGMLLVSDDKRERVLRYDAEGRYLGTFPDRDASKREVTRMLVDGEGDFVTLDEDEKTVGARRDGTTPAEDRPRRTEEARRCRGGSLPEHLCGGRGARRAGLRSPGTAAREGRRSRAAGTRMPWRSTLPVRFWSTTTAKAAPALQLR